MAIVMATCGHAVQQTNLLVVSCNGCVRHSLCAAYASLKCCKEWLKLSKLTGMLAHICVKCIRAAYSSSNVTCQSATYNLGSGLVTHSSRHTSLAVMSKWRLKTRQLSTSCAAVSSDRPASAQYSNNFQAMFPSKTSTNFSLTLVLKSTSHYMGA